MTECLEFARPMVRRGASLCADQTCWQLLKERNYLATLQLAANNHLVSIINAMMRVSRDREHGFQRIVSNDFRGS
jgi:hypothetical protein